MKIWFQRQWKILKLLWSVWLFLHIGQKDVEASFGVDSKRNVTLAMVIAKGIAAQDIHAWILEKFGKENSHEKET